MTSISFGRLAAVRPSVLVETEWFAVPANHEYIGIVRVTNQDSASVTFRLAHTDASGAATGEDWDAYNGVLLPGDFADISYEMGPGATLRYVVSKVDVISFKFTGMDRDNT